MKDKEYYESLDKRSKEYKDWKKSFDKDIKGAGDVVEVVAKKLGFKKGEDCGCDKRKQLLNKVIRWKPVRCFTEDQYNQWTAFRNRKKKNQVTHQEQLLIQELCHDLFARAVKPCSHCGSQFKSYINMIDKFYESYQ